MATKSKTITGANALMSLAKKTVKSTAAKSDDKKTIKVTDKTISDAINSYVDGKRKLQEGKAQVDAASAIINPHAQDFHVIELEKNHRIESFILANDTEAVLSIVQDGYKFAHLNDGERGEEFVADLKDKFGDEIVTTENEFVINKDLVEKYGHVLMGFIAKSKDISDDDRGELIQLKQSHKIAKGTINKLADIAKNAKMTVKEVWAYIMPTMQLKARGEK